MVKRKKVKTISKFKKYFAIVLIILLFLNMILFGIHFINEILFWMDIGVLGGLSYMFFKDKNDK